MTPKLVVNHKTQKDIDNVLVAKPHALGIMGPTGGGKASIANFIASRLLDIPMDQVEGHQSILIIEPENRSIPIDKIRSINQFLKLKTIGRSEVRRVVIIRDAEFMRVEAQNALLKLLEEPPTDTVFLLTCANDHSLLPTIYSRIQKIFIGRPSKKQLEGFLATRGISLTDYSRFLALSDGQIGTLAVLLGKPEGHPLIINTESSKEIISSSVFERLAMVDKLSKDKAELAGLLEALERVSRAALHQQIKNGSAVVKLKKTYGLLDSICVSKENLGHNAHPKLLLTHLFLQF